MRLGGRIAAAIEVLEDMAAHHRPASAALKDWGVSHRFAGSGDRAAIGNMVHDALRRKRSAGYLLGSDSARAQVIGALLLESDHTPETLDSAINGDRFAPPPLDAAERAAVSRNLADAPDPVRGDCPDWCVPMFAEAFGAGWVKEASALAQRPPLDLRVNLLKAAPDKVEHSLARYGARKSDLAATAIRIPPVKGDGRHPNVQAEAGFRKGHFEIQDTGSQLAALLTGAAPGEQVVDYCAGAGGKTLAMAAMMENRGQIFASDADRQRLAPMFDRIRRAGCRNVQTVNDPSELARLEGRADLVVVDAPCTGSGTWRRKPDAKWRLSRAQFDKRISEQAEILQTASGLVKPGGRLAYITCSVFRPENDDRIAAFLERNREFETLDHNAVWADTVSTAPGAETVSPAGITMTPARTATDGFFVSMLRKTGNT